MKRIKKWSNTLDKEKNAKVIKMHESGLSFGKIGKELGISAQRCWRIYKRYAKNVKYNI
jgi:DNA-directed RNA polymerase specialized sigma subunit